MAKKLWQRFYFKFFIFACVLFALSTVILYMVAFEDEDFPEDVMYDVFIDETRDDYKHISLDEEMREELRQIDLQREKSSYDHLPLQDPSDPIILWWTEFTKEQGATQTCGNNRCFFTNNRRYRHHKNMKVFMFYGTDFSIDDLPLPRSDDHQWALFHEESPKNNFILCHEPALSLFNYTSTFRRESDFPLSTQHLYSLDWLLKKTYIKTVDQKDKFQESENLAPIVYVQSDCDPPSDRDKYVKMLMNYIKIDSYGACLNNKKLPNNIASPLDGMAHKDFYEVLSRYKFALSMENAVCDDYMTEKLWRPLMVGTVPIIFGSTKVQDYLPSNHSGLLITDFKNPQNLANFIKELDGDKTEYDKFREWKISGINNHFLQETMRSRSWTPDDEDEHWVPGQKNFVDAFECYVCDKIHENIRRTKNGQEPKHQWGNKNHYGCPRPLKFDDFGRYVKVPSKTDFWSSQWDLEGSEADQLNDCMLHGKKKCQEDSKRYQIKRDF